MKRALWLNDYCKEINLRNWKNAAKEARVHSNAQGEGLARLCLPIRRRPIINIFWPCTPCLMLD